MATGKEKLFRTTPRQHIAAILVLNLLTRFGISLLLSMILVVGCGKSRPREENQPKLASDIESADKGSAIEAETNDDRQNEDFVTVSLTQIKEWAETLSGPPSNLTHNLTRELNALHPYAVDKEKITYLGSTKDYHYFTYPKPYYRVSRQQWPTLKSEFGDVIDDPKDLPHCTLWLNNEMTLDVAHPHFIPFFFSKTDLLTAREVSPSTKSGQLKITATIPYQLPNRSHTEGLIMCQLLHPEMPPKEILFKAEGKDCFIDFTIDEKWLGESRLVLNYCYAIPGNNKYVLKLSEFRNKSPSK